MKPVVAVLVVALLAVAAGCGGKDTPDPEPLASSGGGVSGAVAELAVQPATGSAPVAGITVTGTGRITAVPDIADWSFGVQAEAATASEALESAAGTTRSIVDALRAAGVEQKDLRTEQVSVYPRTSQDGRSVEGFSATSSVSATVRDIGRAGDVVDAAVGAGANQVFGPSLRVSDERSRYQAAVDAAYDDARSRAEAIAAKAGVSLGAPVAIVEGGGFAGGPEMFRGVAADGAAEIAIEPGTQELGASLTVTFAIG